MAGELPSTLFGWIAGLIGLLSAVGGLAFGAWCLWGIVTKHDGTDATLPPLDILVRFLTLLAIFFGIGLLVAWLN